MEAISLLTPVPDALTQPFWDEAKAGRLVVQQCTACGVYQAYPRPICLACRGQEVPWVSARGTGRIYSFVVVEKTMNAEFRGSCPYVLAIVELDEGPRMTTRIVDTPPEWLSCDAPVRVVFPAADGDVVLPGFTVVPP